MLGCCKGREPEERCEGKWAGKKKSGGRFRVCSRVREVFGEDRKGSSFVLQCVFVLLVVKYNLLVVV